MPSVKVSTLLTGSPASNPDGTEGISVDQGGTTKGMTLSQLLHGTMGTGLVNAANDAGAQAAGVVVGGFYRNGSVVMVRVV